MSVGADQPNFKQLIIIFLYIMGPSSGEMLVHTKLPHFIVSVMMIVK